MSFNRRNDTQVFSFSLHNTTPLGLYGRLDRASGQFRIRGRICAEYYQWPTTPQPAKQILSVNPANEEIVPFVFKKRKSRCLNMFVEDVMDIEPNIFGNKKAVERVNQVVRLQTGGTGTVGPSVILMHGHSGCGKLSCIKAACKEHDKHLIRIEYTDFSHNETTTKLTQALFPVTGSVVLLTGIGGMDTSSATQLNESISQLYRNENGRHTNLLVVSDSCKGPLYLSMSSRIGVLVHRLEHIYFNPMDHHEAKRDIKWKDQLCDYFPEELQWNSDLRQLHNIRKMFSDVNQAAVFSERDLFLNCFSVAASMMGGIAKQISHVSTTSDVMFGRVFAAGPEQVAGAILENYAFVLQVQQNMVIVSEQLSVADLIVRKKGLNDVCDDTNIEIASALLCCCMACVRWKKFAVGCRKGDFFSVYGMMQDARDTHRERSSLYTAQEWLNRTV